MVKAQHGAGAAAFFSSHRGPQGLYSAPIRAAVKALAVPKDVRS
jgi:hypothetical protein